MTGTAGAPTPGDPSGDATGTAAEDGGSDGSGRTAGAPEAGTEVESSGSGHSVTWFSDYVYGTIATLVAIAGLTNEKYPGALTTAGVVVVGAVAIWLAHALSQLVSRRSWSHLELTASDVVAELRGSWSIVSAAIPASIIFVLAGAHVFTIGTAFTLAEVVGVLALAVVGVGTVGGSERPLGRRLLYVVGLVLVGVLIVLLELAVHLL